MVCENLPSSTSLGWLSTQGDKFDTRRVGSTVQFSKGEVQPSAESLFTAPLHPLGRGFSWSSNGTEDFRFAFCTGSWDSLLCRKKTPQTRYINHTGGTAVQSAWRHAGTWNSPAWRRQQTPQALASSSLNIWFWLQPLGLTVSAPTTRLDHLHSRNKSPGLLNHSPVL